MAIYAVMAESSEIDWAGASGYSTNTSNYNGNASRNSLFIEDGLYEPRVSWVTSLSEGWVHFLVSSIGAMNLDTLFVHGSDVVAGVYTQQWRIMGHSATELKVELWNGTVWSTLGSVFTGNMTGGLFKIDVHVLHHATTGIFRVYVDGVLVFDFSGAVQTATNTFNGIGFGSPDAANADDLSQVIVSNESTVNMSLVTIEPTSNSLTTNWTGSFTDVNSHDHVIEGSFASTDTLNAQLRFGHAAVHADFSNQTVKAVVVASVSSIDSGGIVTDFQHSLTVSATDYNSASLTVANNSANHFNQTIWDTNPNTTAVWTVAEVDAMTYGVKPI